MALLTLPPFISSAQYLVLQLPTRGSFSSPPSDVSGLSTYHTALLSLWFSLGKKCSPKDVPLELFRFVPLKPNLFFHHLDITLSSAWKLTSYRSLHDLISEDSWLDPSRIPIVGNLTTPAHRQLCLDLAAINAKISLSAPTVLRSFSSLISIEVASERKFLNIDVMSRASIYDLSLHIIYSKGSFPLHHVERFIPESKEIMPVWKASYRSPSTKLDGDTAWRLLHNCLSSPSLVHKINSSIPSSCPLCGSEGTTMHMFLVCPGLSLLSAYLQNILFTISCDLRLDLKTFLFHLFPGRCSVLKTTVGLVDFLLTLAKSSIYKTYMSALSSMTAPPNYVSVFQKQLIMRIKQDFIFTYRNDRDFDRFRVFWRPLADVVDDKLWHS